MEGSFHESGKTQLFRTVALPRCLDRDGLFRKLILVQAKPNVNRSSAQTLIQEECSSRELYQAHAWFVPAYREVLER